RGSTVAVDRTARGNVQPPRTRGDQPQPLSARFAAQGNPPHTRECTSSRRERPGIDAPPPGHGGLHPAPPISLISCTNPPHTRGSTPFSESHYRVGLLLPTQRGSTVVRPWDDLGADLLPAHAGINRRFSGIVGRRCVPYHHGRDED